MSIADSKMNNTFIMNASFSGGGFEYIINDKGKGLIDTGKVPKFSYYC